MAQASIVGMDKTFSQDPNRQGKVDRIVLYRTDKDAITRWVTIPEETFTIDKAQEAIRKFEAERNLANPITFTY